MLLAAVTAGCGSRGLPAGTGPDDGAGQEAAETQPAAEPTATGAIEPGPPAVSAGPPAATDVPAATGEPVASPHPPPTLAPLVAPDLTAIEQLLVDLDAALGADATADTEEGSAP